MDQEIKYSAALAALMFAVMAFPGFAAASLNIPLLTMSFGLAIGVVLCVKGQVACRIFGNDSEHRSLPGAGLIIIGLVAFKGAANIWAGIEEAKLMKEIFGMEPVSQSMIWSRYMDFLGVSLLYAFGSFVVMVAFAFYRSAHPKKFVAKED